MVDKRRPLENIFIAIAEMVVEKEREEQRARFAALQKDAVNKAIADLNATCDAPPELLPCPFCGGKPAVEARGPHASWCAVFCTEEKDCTARVTAKNRKVAVDRWNRRAAPPMESDSWIPWAGGLCPVADGTMVDVMLRNGSFFERQLAYQKPTLQPRTSRTSVASGSRWRNDDHPADIVAYRVSGR